MANFLFGAQARSFLSSVRLVLEGPNSWVSSLHKNGLAYKSFKYKSRLNTALLTTPTAAACCRLLWQGGGGIGNDKGRWRWSKWDDLVTLVIGGKWCQHFFFQNSFSFCKKFRKKVILAVFYQDLEKMPKNAQNHGAYFCPLKNAWGV